MDPGISALIVLAVLVASVLIFTIVFILVADRELARSEPQGRDEDRLRRETPGDEHDPPDPGGGRVE